MLTFRNNVQCFDLQSAASCEPALFFWLIEELLDSQSIDGCRKVFDYLESRRERIVAVSYQKQVIADENC